MTEDEAKQKWCPMFRVGDSLYVADADQTLATTTNLGCKCVASNCMMWRWSEKGKDGTPLPSGGTWKPGKGYCGLAGRHDR